MKKIIVDVMGADKGPAELVCGAIKALNENEDLYLILSGDEKLISEALLNLTYDKKRLEILNASEVITNNDIPTNAIREKKDSSLIKAASYLKEKDDIVGMTSSGSTGAVLCASTLILGRINGVTRPSLSTMLPAENGKLVCLLDCGANVDCKPQMLLEFALMGSECMKTFENIESPRVALLSVGTEDKKGNELTKAAFALLKESSLNFVGNMEARDVLSGKYDVIVCDGFVGNVILKNIEGTAKTILSQTAKSLLSIPNIDKGVISKALNDLIFEMDFNSRGGAIFLGVKKIVVKTHGCANSSTIYHAINQVYRLSCGDLISKLNSVI